ncbi:hypothetical protein Cflav_PD2288 [Pedosphaera parvula Ellin514]|uniref:Uncharacterized protein n=1 Tax=Pedosphaera parvula (strain Ellin514) TaxID=320771 RepID=B9XL93_PEDPL|nr:hypothetical protein Cflav_PD2288 [Pedosphaera parvula Ellin514]
MTTILELNSRPRRSPQNKSPDGELAGGLDFLKTKVNKLSVGEQGMMVESTGIEPATFSLRTRRSTN